MSLSRRQILIGAAGSAFALGLVLHQQGHIAFRLEALGTCRKCKACREHAKHKWFASFDEVTRAHPHCKCKVVAVRITSEEFERMFTTARHFDLRRVERLV